MLVALHSLQEPGLVNDIFNSVQGITNEARRALSNPEMSHELGNRYVLLLQHTITKQPIPRHNHACKFFQTLINGKSRPFQWR